MSASYQLLTLQFQISGCIFELSVRIEPVLFTARSNTITGAVEARVDHVVHPAFASLHETLRLRRIVEV